MKLLFDHNLSHKLVGRLADVFPGSEHVRNLDLHRADDAEVWEYARINALAIVSKDKGRHAQGTVGIPPPTMNDSTREDVSVWLAPSWYEPNIDRTELAALMQRSRETAFRTRRPLR